MGASSVKQSDKYAFKEILDGVSEMYQRKEPISSVAMQLYFSALEKYSIGQVTGAISCHISDPKHGSFYPKVSDIVRHIEGGEVTTDMVLSAARLKESPFGILCRIQIGTWDLDNQKDMFYLKQRAQECIDKLPEWKSRALGGEYSDHEISIMLKHDVSPVSSFMPGLQSAPNHEALLARVDIILNSDRHKFLVAIPEIEEEEIDDELKPSMEVVKFLEEIK